MVKSIKLNENKTLKLNNVISCRMDMDEKSSFEQEINNFSKSPFSDKMKEKGGITNARATGLAGIPGRWTAAEQGAA